MKILYLAHRIPYPPNKGDKIRSFHEIKHLSQSHQIDLACLADHPPDMRYAWDLQRFCRKVFVSPLNRKRALLNGILALCTGRPLSVGYFHSRQLQETVNAWTLSESYDAVICFSSPMAEYVYRSSVFGKDDFALPEPSGNRRRESPILIMDFCDLDSDKWAQYADSAPFPLSLAYRLEHRSLSQYENRIADIFDHSIFVSEKERELFGRNHPDLSRVVVIPNGVDFEYFDPDQEFGPLTLPHESTVPNPETDGPVLLFTGAMDYHANIDGVRWFCREIFPLIKQKLPSAKFYIVGSNPAREIRGLQNGVDIFVAGFVEDIRPYYEKADVSVIPLRLARGVQNKVLEAMAMARAVVATSKSVDGIHVVSGKHLVLADSAAEMAAELRVLMGEEKSRLALGKAARQHVLANYDWSSNMQELAYLLL